MDLIKRLLLFSVALQLLLFSQFVSSDDAKDREDCAESLAGLATCLPYVSGNAKAPTPDCCGGLKQVLRTKKKCLCVIVRDRDDPALGLSINVTLALSLPQVCDSPANISQCPQLLNLPPNSAEAQVFYQFGNKSSNTAATSPLAGGPKPAPSTVGAAPGSAGPQQSGSSLNGKTVGIVGWSGVEILVGLIVCWIFALDLSL